MHRIGMILALALGSMVACDSGKETGDTSGTDTSDTSDTADTSDTDTGTDTGNDTGNETGDTGDTNPPIPDRGYFGPPTVAALVSDGAGGASVYLIDPGAGTATEITGVAAEADDVFACAGQYVWVLGDDAWGISARDGTLGQTLTLDDTFEPQAIAYMSPLLFVGGTGSALLASFAADGTAGGTVDLSSLADADGIPEVMALTPSSSGLAAVLQRSSGSTYDTSSVALIDPIGLTVTGSGSLNGGNAGRAAGTSGPSVVVVLDEHGSTGTTVDMFDPATATATAFLDLGSSVVATAVAGGDGTLWAATGTSGAVTVKQYTQDGTEIASFSAATTGNLIAPGMPSVWSGEGTGAVPYDPISGTAGTVVDLGGAVLALHACSPPPMEPSDTGDTAGDPPQ